MVATESLVSLGVRVYIRFRVKGMEHGPSSLEKGAGVCTFCYNADPRREYII